MSDHEELIARILAGEAGQAEIDTARTDPAFVERLHAHAGIEALLGITLADEFSRERHHQRIMAAVKAADRESFVAGVKSRVHHRRLWKRGLAAAAVLMISLGSWYYVTSRPASTVATVSRVETVTWSAGHALNAGSILKTGDSLQLTSGLVELDVAGRGRMVVEGPAFLEFPAPGRAILTRGRMVMRVTEAGHGYRVETAKGSVVDLGTEFGVAVGEDGQVETQVLEGRVEALPEGGERILLAKDDALRFGTGRIPSDDGGFYTSLPPLHATADFVHWSFDGATSATVPAEEHGDLPPGPKDLVLHSIEPGEPPKWTKGVFGQALAFDGRGSYAESGFLGIGGDHPRTVCFWVKVPRDLADTEGFAILSWGRFQAAHPGEVWQIAINPLVKDGQIGRIRVGTHQGQVIGTTDLRDDTWHHVAIVLYGGSQVNVGTHVLVYLDGKLEPISRRALREVNTEVETAGHGVWLGRDITAPDKHPGGFFRGAIDEPYIFDAALSQDDIGKLIKFNSFHEK